jgi:hypothetical protein
MGGKMNILKKETILPLTNFKLLFKIKGSSIIYCNFFKVCNLCWAPIEIIRLSRQKT